MAGSTYITSSFNGTGSSTGAKSTHSVWVKRCDPEHVTSPTARSSVVAGKTDSNNYMKTRFADGDAFHVYGAHGGSGNVDLYTSIQSRDVGAWLHLCLQVDTSHATEAERVKIFINGVEGTYSGTYPAQNNPNYLTRPNTVNIGGNQDGTEEFDGYMSHFHCIDGTIYPPTAFAETDATSGEWKPIVEPSVTYGSKGYFIFKDGAGITDQSGNGNDFTVGAGTLTATQDNPSNNFATLNNLDGALGDSTFTYGNTRWNSETAGNVTWAKSTLGINKGKFYFEAKLETASDHNYIGVSDRPSASTSTYFGAGAYDYGYKSSSGDKKNNNTSTSYGDTYTTNDIVQCAVDLDNLKVYFGKNGTWQNSGDPTSGATGTGAAYTITAPSSTTSGFYFLCVADGTASNNSRWQPNFGNGYFGTSAIASEGTNASNIGKFEYDVPTGYTALSTKGLNA